MATTSSSRMEKLRAWRQETGRTPMKRLSYVVECAARCPRPKVATPSTALSSKHTKQPTGSFKAPPTPHPGPLGRRGPHSRENHPPPRPRTREGAKTTTAQRGRSLTKQELTQLRKKMLEEWRAKNGRTLKRPPLFLKQASRTEKPSRPHKRRHTFGGIGGGGGGGIGGGGGGGGGGGVGFKSCGKGERELLKERLQQEIAEDCEVEMVEGEGGEWEAHTTSGGESKDEKKEENDEDNNDGFKSRRVRFMLSEPRRRRSCYASLTPAPTPRTLYLTPVRRSTRTGRNQDGPGMHLDSERCFDSPSDVSKQLDFDDLQIIENNMLP